MVNIKKINGKNNYSKIGGEEKKLERLQRFFFFKAEKAHTKS